VASAIADEKKLERQMNEQLNQAEEWERKAVLALRAEKEDLAKEALVRKQDFEAMATQYKTQWEAQHAPVEKLKVALRQLQQKIEEAQRKKNLLVARAKRADAQKKIQQTMGSFSDTSAFEAFDRMAAKVEKIEAEVEAMQEIEGATMQDDLESRFKALESSGKTADLLLEDLKKRLQDESSHN
jgi:phage shock protein A